MVVRLNKSGRLIGGGRVKRTLSISTTSIARVSIGLLGSNLVDRVPCRNIRVARGKRLVTGGLVQGRQL